MSVIDYKGCQRTEVAVVILFVDCRGCHARGQRLSKVIGCHRSSQVRRCQGGCHRSETFAKGERLRKDSDFHRSGDAKGQRLLENRDQSKNRGRDSKAPYIVTNTEIQNAARAQLKQKKYFEALLPDGKGILTGRGGPGSIPCSPPLPAACYSPGDLHHPGTQSLKKKYQVI